MKNNPGVLTGVVEGLVVEDRAMDEADSLWLEFDERGEVLECGVAEVVDDGDLGRRWRGGHRRGVRR